MYSLVLPVYNEERSVEAIVTEYHAALSSLPYAFEIVAVDDCSSDTSAEILERLPVRLIRNDVNYGYGKSLKNGIAAARFDHIIITDSDNTYPAALLNRLIEEYGKGNNMTVAARKGGNFQTNLAEKCARKLLRFLIEGLCNYNIEDVNSGYRIFNRTHFRQYLPLMSNQFSFTTSITMISVYTNVPIVYVPFTYGKRTGKSKVSYVKDTLKTVQRALALFYHFRIRSSNKI